MRSSISFEGDGSINYRYIDWAELGEVAENLVTKISKSGKKFDRLIALATGGHTASRAIKDYLNIPRLSSLQISFYKGIGQTAKSPVIIQSLPTDVSGENLLVFDDVNDSGETMRTAVNYLKMCGAKSITTAVLFAKPVSKFPSDFAGEESTNWLVFPDEIRETITLLTIKWESQGIIHDKINERLLAIGFKDTQINLVEEL